MIFVDSNVFLIDLRYPRDQNASVNSKFLKHLKEHGKGVTSIFNLLEVLGVLSFNLNDKQLRNLFRLFPSRYGVSLLPDSNPNSLLPTWSASHMVERLSKKLSLGDALMLEHAETVAYRIESIVSWDAPHFVGRTQLSLHTPQQFLECYASE